MIRVKGDPLERDIQVLLDQELGPRARSAILAAAATEAFAEADEINAAAFGRPVRRHNFVDGKEGDNFLSVRPDGRIVAAFDLLGPALTWMFAAIVQHSPVRDGTYVSSHEVFADGDRIALEDGTEDGFAPEIGANMATAEFVYVPTVDYARNIERGWSKQAPDGVYQVVAELGKGQFGAFMSIEFGWRTVTMGTDTKWRRKAKSAAARDLTQPAIIARLK